MILKIVTSSFPFPDAAEQTFLEQELSVLCGAIDAEMELSVVPGYTTCDWTNAANYTTPGDQYYKIDYSLLKARANIGYLRRLLVLVETLRAMRYWIPKYKSPEGTENSNIAARFREVARFADQYVVMRYALRKRLLICNTNDIVCTWWLNGYTNALVRHYRDIGNTRPVIVSRAHGGDLFSDQGPQVRQPETVNGLDKVFPSTRAGSQYLRRIGVPNEKIEVARLGTIDFASETESLGQVTEAGTHSSNDSLTVLTISSTAPIKRIPMLSHHLDEVARTFNVPIRWLHYGQPIEANDLPKTKIIIPINRGWLAQNEIFAEILSGKKRTRCVAVSYSASEGTCLSLVEAACLSMPLIGCNVGGVPEIVTGSSGVLLPALPKPEHLRDALLEIYENYDNFATGARALWDKDFSAKNVYQEFVNSLESLRYRVTSLRNTEVL